MVDGNVFRVLSRYFDVETDIALASAKKEFAALAFEIMPKGTPALFNQAIMEFGALQCVPKSPNCEICVMNSGCAALQKKKVHLLPVKSKKIKVRARYFNYLILKDENQKTIIQKRIHKGIWHNLYEFPLIETEAEVDFETISVQLKENFPVDNEICSVTQMNLESKIHKLSHQHLYIKFWEVKVKGTVINGIDHETVLTLPFPIVLYNFIEKEFFN